MSNPNNYSDKDLLIVKTVRSNALPDNVIFAFDMNNGLFKNIFNSVFNNALLGGMHDALRESMNKNYYDNELGGASNTNQGRYGQSNNRGQQNDSGCRIAKTTGECDRREHPYREGNPRNMSSVRYDDDYDRYNNMYDRNRNNDMYDRNRNNNNNNNNDLYSRSNVASDDIVVDKALLSTVFKNT
ncbi:ORF MSV172 hypothetical protein [Melanoplus sanguinipes entomopoxvirus]|uniref:Uncharacterized protein n=1 Tax=Melanoplus sanguinipes entomopoxvirus TaxID=83191 RepID=Q9YVS0_MSEPV|nr:ORF MSV172 hypothetical protein [Melanoplus sanguinipes entomopoxvirus]AAC97686.1 ORF MSV172 hypothetical protein [Melanoplus sanguinipes entomopoxvirus 'O']